MRARRTRPGAGSARVDAIRAASCSSSAVFYLLVIRPQNKKASCTSRCCPSSRRATTSSPPAASSARSRGIKDDEITLQVQEGVRLRVLRSADHRPAHPRRRGGQGRRQGLLVISSLVSGGSHGTILVVEGGPVRGSSRFSLVCIWCPRWCPRSKQPAFIQEVLHRSGSSRASTSQGGLHLVYEVDIDKAVSDKVDQLANALEDSLRKKDARRHRRARGSRRHRLQVQEPGRPSPSWTRSVLAEYRDALDEVSRDADHGRGSPAAGSRSGRGDARTSPCARASRPSAVASTSSASPSRPSSRRAPTSSSSCPA